MAARNIDAAHIFYRALKLEIFKRGALIQNSIFPKSNTHRKNKEE
jgi:hypothetical protein